MWCRRGEGVIEFDVELGAPYQVGELWYCEWSMGTLTAHRLLPSHSICSMHALACAQVGISSYLHTCKKNGDRFYIEADANAEELDDIDPFFPHLKISRVGGISPLD
jgi:hypothetical protein